MVANLVALIDFDSSSICFVAFGRGDDKLHEVCPVCVCHIPRFDVFEVPLDETPCLASEGLHLRRVAAAGVMTQGSK